MMDMPEQAKRSRAEYMREYRRKNRERINAKRREWRQKNKDKVAEYNRRYWMKKAAQAAASDR